MSVIERRRRPRKVEKNGGGGCACSHSDYCLIVIDTY
jgi:hypothetical protein